MTQCTCTKLCTKKKVKHPMFFSMTKDTTRITRLMTRQSQERNGDLLVHYIGCKKPQQNKKNFNLMNI